MERFLTLGFLIMMHDLRETEQNLYEHSKLDALGQEPEISDTHDKYIRALMAVVRQNCNALKMKEWVDEPIMRISHVLTRINGHSRDTGGRKYSAVQYEIKGLRQSIEHSLNSRLFLFMTPEDAAFYDKDDLFGIRENFPVANKEITAASSCYATGNYTACVFHLMRAVEIGAKVMVYAMRAQNHITTTINVRGVKTIVKKPIELCDWKTLIDGLNNARKALEAGTKTSVKKKETLAYYSHAIAQFSNFKDAWRNIISHGHEIERGRKLYLAGETTDIMNNTRLFMQHLAKRLKEKV